jgi:hypothetical protein
LSLVLLGASPSPVGAEPAESEAEGDTSSKAVDELVARGREQRQAGNDAAALELFRRAEELQPTSTRLRVHLAAAYQALGQWEAADRYLSLALEDPTDPYVEKHRDILAEARASIDTHMASLDVMGGPAGAQVLLSGRVLGTLPLKAPIRVEAGIYTLEARLAHHYPVTRSVAMAGGALVREQISLVPMARDEGMRSAGAAPSKLSGATWVPWTFAGLAAGAGAVAIVGWAERERYAKRWNDDSECLRPNLMRGDVCADERLSGQRAETWMWIGTAGAGVFAAASVLSFWLVGDNEPEREQTPTAEMSCGVGLGQLQCAGRF